MSFTIAEFRARFPQFASATTYPDTLIDSVIQEAERRINFTFFGSRADDAWRYLTAHLLATTGTAAVGASSSMASSGVRSVTAGSVSISYGETSSSSSGSSTRFDSTAYGREYQALIKLLGGARLAG